MNLQDKAAFYKISNEIANFIYYQIYTYLELDYLLDPLSVKTDDEGNILDFEYKIERKVEGEIYYDTAFYKNKKSDIELRNFNLTYITSVLPEEKELANDVIYNDLLKLHKGYKINLVNTKHDVDFNLVKKKIRNGIYIRESGTLNYLHVKEFKIDNDKKKIHLDCLRSDRIPCKYIIPSYIDFHIIDDINEYKKLYDVILMEFDWLYKSSTSYVLRLYRSVTYNYSCGDHIYSYKYDLNKIEDIAKKLNIKIDESMLIKTILNIKDNIK